MKPSILDENQFGDKSIKCQTGTAAETIAKQAPQPKDFVVVFTFKSVADELNCIEFATHAIDVYTKETQLYHTNIDHVYVISIDIQKGAKRREMEKLYNALSNYFKNNIGNGDILIQSYYRADMYINTDHTIKAERCVLDIHVNKKTPLDEDFVFTITNRYSNQSESFILESDSKVIKVK